MSRTVFFKPLPFSGSGTEQWIPHGLAYRPFHVDHEEIDSEATEACTFAPSSAVEIYLHEFNQTIRPLFKVRSFDKSICALLTEESRIHPPAVRILSAFKDRVMGEMLKFKHDLDKDPEVAKQVRFDEAEAVDDGALAMQLVKADMLSTHSKLIELKSWVCMFTELHDHLAPKKVRKAALVEPAPAKPQPQPELKAKSLLTPASEDAGLADVLGAIRAAPEGSGKAHGKRKGR
ncbi:hypothetical protein B0H16DRAFT_1895266 [Mycena metata]|uniref:Uncharacterized protein n=1 Tax=Mycena metata TaxID=1033252 RepID=A0AAD7MNG7_9AGAR|nr:hypothetical protein B0H16DRAFT_1895266 [Mycena metata]